LVCEVISSGNFKGDFLRNLESRLKSSGKSRGMPFYGLDLALGRSGKANLGISSGGFPAGSWLSFVSGLLRASFRLERITGKLPGIPRMKAGPEDWPWNL